MTQKESWIGAIDAGTSSTRFLLFDKQLNLKHVEQEELPRSSLASGWAEMDAEAIYQTTFRVVALGTQKADNNGAMVACCGLANQRETVVAWSRSSGKALHAAILWMDTRTAPIVAELSEKPGAGEVIAKTGLKMATYFSAFKMVWLLRNVPQVAQAQANSDLCFGTVDSWLTWRLTGGPNGGRFVTDVTNASRTMLMNLESCSWDTQCLEFFGISPETLPAIHPSSADFGTISVPSLVEVLFTPEQGSFAPYKIPLYGILGDQQAALLGHRCMNQGQAKCTYGTGCFLLYNTGFERVHSANGLLSTVAYQLGREKPVTYALEGSVATAGSAVRWLRDQAKVISSYNEVDKLAQTVGDSAGVVFVPALNGLFAPYWSSSTRGTLLGLSESTTSAHIVRATLEGVASQVKDILRAMHADSSFEPTMLNVDGGLTFSHSMMQIQADVLGCQVVRPENPELTALGVAFAAAFHCGMISSSEYFELGRAAPASTFQSSKDEEWRASTDSRWQRAVNLALNF